MTVKYHPLTLVLIGLVAATACTPEEIDSGRVVLEQFRERVAAREADMLLDCQEKVIEEATRRADSLLLDRARRMRRIEGRPPRPYRPGMPPVKELSQPLPLRPLFPFEIRFDTLLRDSLFQDSLRTDSLEQGLLPVVPVEDF
jgi:hypothetical protein